jgi:hypothetical protein
VYVALEIAKQRIRIDETIGFLDIPDVPAVALARLVIVTQDTASIDHEGRPVF